MSIEVHVVHDRLKRRRKTRQKRGLQIERIAGKHLVDQERDEIAGIESGFEIAVRRNVDR